MNNIKFFNSKQNIHQQACEWISRFDRGLTEAEEQTAVTNPWVELQTSPHLGIGAARGRAQKRRAEGCSLHSHLR